MDEYTPIYCCRCSQLQFQNFRGKPCQFCGSTTFANVRPKPTFTQIDQKALRQLDIPDPEKEPKA